MSKKIGICLFMLILIALPVITLVMNPKEDKPFSENENRYLSEYPELSLESVKDENFMTGFDSWFSDRFYGRESWISLKNKTELAMGKNEVDTVYTKDDQMMQLLSGYTGIGELCDSKKVDRNITSMNYLASLYPDIDMYFMLCPTSVGIYGDNLLKKSISNVITDEKMFITDSYDKLEGIKGIDVFSPLYDEKNDYIYYRTDHHWTSLGAFTAYQTLCDTLGVTAHDLSEYNVETASSSFQGTLFSKTLDQSVTKDNIDLYTLKSDPAFKVETSNGINTEETDTIFYREFLDVKDKYSTYTGQNVAVFTVTNTSGNTNGKSLLLFKDSYANSMIQFLATTYDKVTMVDLRYLNLPVTDVINIEDYDQTVFIANCITFSTETSLTKLGLAQ